MTHPKEIGSSQGVSWESYLPGGSVTSPQITLLVGAILIFLANQGVFGAPGSRGFIGGHVCGFLFSASSLLRTYLEHKSISRANTIRVTCQEAQEYAREAINRARKDLPFCSSSEQKTTTPEKHAACQHRVQLDDQCKKYMDSDPWAHQEVLEAYENLIKLYYHFCCRCKPKDRAAIKKDFETLYQQCPRSQAHSPHFKRCTILRDNLNEMKEEVNDRKTNL